LYRIISNLVRNARQAIVATTKPGDIIVAASENDEFWTIEVTDTGPGLPAKAQEHLFTPFQGGLSKGGSGLGMAISEELMRGHGGSLELVRTSDKGTVFCIKLPKGDLSLSK
jgi:signal transduction histidine kinase